MPTVDDAGKVASLVRADAVALFAAFFFLTTIALGVALWRSNKASTKTIIRLAEDRALLAQDQTRLVVALLQGKKVPLPALRRKARPAEEVPDVQPEEEAG